MKFGKTASEKGAELMRRTLADRQPKAWFAWWPVLLDDTGQVAWLETVKTKRSSVLDRWHYYTAATQEAK